MHAATNASEQAPPHSTSHVSDTTSQSFRGCSFHGIPLFEESHEDWRNRLKHRLGTSTPQPCSRIHTINPEILSHGLRNPAYLDILCTGTWCVVDGLWLATALALRKGIFLRRRCGSDLIDDLLEGCQTSGQPFFLLGGSPESNDIACANIRRRYPGIQCAGLSPNVSPTALPSETAELEDALRRLRPGVVAVCLGAPKQETWMYKNAALLEECGVKIAAGLGGTVDFLSGKIPRAPLLMRRIGLEWLYRAVREPFRFQRYYMALPALFAKES